MYFAFLEIEKNPLHLFQLLSANVASKALRSVNSTNYTRLNLNESSYWLYNLRVSCIVSLGENTKFLAEITIILGNNEVFFNFNH